MPVQQLTDAAGPGVLLGMVGGYLAGNPERKAKKAQQDIENKRNAASDARLDGEAADRARDTADQIQDRDQTLKIAQGKNDVATRSAVAYAKYAPMMDTVPKGPDGKALQGPALQNALNQIKNKAIGEGLQGEDLARLMTDAQGVMQRNAPKLADVTHGMQQLPVAKPAGKDGKGGVAGATPEQEVHHWMDAASRVANSDMDPEAKKTAIAMYQKNAADALARVPKPETPADAERTRHDKVMEGLGGQKITIQENRGAGGGIGAQDLAERKREFAIEHPTDPKTGKALPKAAPKETTPEARGADYTAAAKAIAAGADRDAVVKRFAAKWQLAPDKADALFP